MKDNLSSPDSQIHKQFLMHCLRSRLDAGALQRAQSLAVRMDSNDFGELVLVAGATRLAPLLYTIVKDKNLVPGNVEDLLSIAYQRNESSLSRQEIELTRVLDALSKQGIDVILLQGIALFETVYQSLPIRVIGDIDLLIAERDVPAALSAMSRLAYSTEYTVRPQVTAKLLRYTNELSFLNSRAPQNLIDVHWHPYRFAYLRHRITMDWFWESKKPVAVSSSEAYVLGTEAAIFHLCTHLFKHGPGPELPQLRWLHDIAELLHAYNPAIDWDLLLARARSYDVVMPLQAVLPLVEREWRVNIPIEFMAALMAVEPSPAEKNAYRQLTRVQASSLAEYGMPNLISLPSWQARARWIWDTTISPPPEVIAAANSNSSRSAAAMYVNYLVKLLRKNAPQMLHRNSGT